MTSISDFLFNNLGRIGSENVDNTQRNLANSRYANYMLQPPNTTSADNHVMFATQQPKINFRRGGDGVGIPAGVVDYDSLLLIKANQVRTFEPLQLVQRPFATIPYLGKGSVDPVLESQLMQGQMVSDRKSLAPVTDKPYIDYPMMDDVRERVTNPVFSVEESALSGWTRGGVPTREMN